MISVLGDGAFGTALAQVLAHNDHKVTLWCYNPEVATSITTKRRNQLYLPSIELHENITPSTSLEESLQANWIVEAIPVGYLPSVLATIKKVNPTTPWVLASKGISEDKLPADIITSFLGPIPIVILSGPSFARELAAGNPTGLTLASATHAHAFKELLESKTISTDTTTDIIGTQLCGALKNVIALTLGMLEGAGYSANTRALVFTNMMKELAEIITDKGGSQKTLQLFAGIGDITLTTFNSQSRNTTLGRAIGRKEYLHKELPYTEGINTLKSLPGYLTKNYRIFSQVPKIVVEHSPLETLL